MGLDQWANFYSIYTVLGSKIEVTGMVNGGSAATQRMGVTPTGTSSAFASGDAERAEELPYAKVASYQPGGNNNNMTGVQRVKSYMSTDKMLGLATGTAKIEDDYSALFTANPAAPWFWHVWNYVPAGETQSLVCLVKLTFYVVLSARTTMVVS